VPYLEKLDRRWLMLAGLIALGPLTSCFYVPTDPGNTTKCSPGYCYIRSAYTCCPNGYLNYAGAGSGCFSTRDACLRAGGGKCWWESSCIP